MRISGGAIQPSALQKQWMGVCLCGRPGRECPAMSVANRQDESYAAGGSLIYIICFACFQVRRPRCSARSRSVFRALSKLTAQAQWLMYLTLRMGRPQRLPFSSSLHSARVFIQRSLHWGQAITSSPCRCSVVELQGAVKASSASAASLLQR